MQEDSEQVKVKMRPEGLLEVCLGRRRDVPYRKIFLSEKI
jgi:hypothetical protein